MFDEIRRHRGRRVSAAALTLSVALAGCSGEPEPAENNDDSGNNSTIKPPPKTPKWSSEVIARDAGRAVRAATAPDGTVGVAFFADAAVEGDDCTELMVDPPPKKLVWELYYAQQSGDSWQVETALEPNYINQPQGLALAFDAQNSPMIVTMTGEPLAALRYCGVNDVGLLTRGGDGQWTTETVVASSGEAATGMPASDYGDVVGLWPAITLDGAGNPVIAYKDVHSGSIMSDDMRRADLELAWRRGGWDNIAVDAGQGAGDRNQLLFDGQDRLVIASYTPTESQDMAKRGVWVRRMLEDDTFEAVQLFNQATPGGHALAWHPTEEALYALFYQSVKGYPELVRLEDDAQFASSSEGWAFEDIGDSRYDEGYSPSIAFSKTGRMAVAYYRCTKATATLGDCLPEDDALVFKWRDAGEWVTELVDEGDAQGLCGMSPSLTVDGDGRPVIAYQCEVVEDGQLTTVVKVARRKALP